MSMEFDEQRRIEADRALVAMAGKVFRTLFLLNGGAVVGMVASIDRIADIVDFASLQRSLRDFVLGLVAAGAATLLAYLAQSRRHAADAGAGPGRGGASAWFARIAFLLCAASLLLFCRGALTAVDGILPPDDYDAPSSDQML